MSSKFEGGYLFGSGYGIILSELCILNFSRYCMELLSDMYYVLNRIEIVGSHDEKDKGFHRRKY
jgi:hypothetical protein